MTHIKEPPAYPGRFNVTEPLRMVTDACVVNNDFEQHIPVDRILLIVILFLGLILFAKAIKIHR